MIDSWPLTPAYLQGRGMTILAANPLARVLLPPYFAPQVNVLRAAFLEPEAREWVRNWDALTAMLVSWLRFLVAEERSSDLELQSLIGELSIASQRFRTLWARQDVKQKTSGPALFDHPQVGPLELRYRLPSSGYTPGTGHLLRRTRHTLGGTPAPAFRPRISADVALPMC